MAITGSALQTALGTDEKSPRVIREYGTFGTAQLWYVSGGATVNGRTRNVSTTAANNAANQAVEVLAALRA